MNVCDCKVYIERCNVPLSFALAREDVRQQVKEILLEDLGMGVGQWLHQKHTFRQMVYLGQDRKIPTETYDKIFEVFACADQEQPILLIEMYPYLAQEEWALSMKEVSNMKVDVRFGDEWGCDVEKIHGHFDSCGDKWSLTLVAISEMDEMDCNYAKGEKQYVIPFETEHLMHAFMKMILLDGSADLLKVTR